MSEHESHAISYIMRTVNIVSSCVATTCRMNDRRGLAANVVGRTDRASKEDCSRIRIVLSYNTVQ